MWLHLFCKYLLHKRCKRHIYKEAQLLNQDDRPTYQWVVCSLKLTVSTSTSSLSLYFCSRFLSPLPGVEAQLLAWIFLRLFHLQMLKFVMIVMSVYWDFPSNVNVEKKKIIPQSCLFLGSWCISVMQNKPNDKWNQSLKKTKPNWINHLLLEID